MAIVHGCTVSNGNILVPGHSTPPVFDHLQYVKTEGEECYHVIRGTDGMLSHLLSTAKSCARPVLHSVLAMKMGLELAESYNEHMKHTQAAIQVTSMNIPSSDTIISRSEKAIWSCTQPSLSGYVCFKPGYVSEIGPTSFLEIVSVQTTSL